MVRSRPRMPRPDSSDPHESFQAFLQRVARPIEFACRDAYAHLPTIKNLDRFVSEQVIGALGERLHPRALEVELLSLRSLFVDFHAGLTPVEQQHRLTQALQLLRRIQEGPPVTDPPGKTLNVRGAVHATTSHDSERLPLDSSIQFVRGVGPKRALLLKRLGIQFGQGYLYAKPLPAAEASVFLARNREKMRKH